MKEVIRRAALLGTVSLLLAACLGGEQSAEDKPITLATEPLHDPDIAAEYRRYYEQIPVWSSCYEKLECARVEVPLNWDNPLGKTIDIAITRQPVRADTVGYLFYNPGGPGVSAIELLTRLVPLSPRSNAKYSVVAVDPRGVQNSSRVSCMSDQDKDRLLFGIPKEPWGSEAYEQLIQKQRDEFAKGCKERTGDLLTFVDTVNAAKDFDVIRSLVGSRTFNYLGYSYGTYLGAMYATLFPTRVGRMVLDSPYNNDMPSEETLFRQAQGFEKSLTTFLEYCRDERDCLFFGKSPEESKSELVRKHQQLREKPIMMDDRLGLDGDDFAMAILASLYSTQGWPLLRRALEDLFKKDDPKPMARMVYAYYGRDDDGRYATNTADAMVAINCLDHRPSEVDGRDAKAGSPAVANTSANTKATTPAAAPRPRYKGSAYQLRQKLPFFHVLIDSPVTQNPCTGWPVQRASKWVDIDAKAAAEKILVVASTGDNATPYDWAESFVSRLGNATLITREGEGHGAYNHGNSCIDDAVDEFLLYGELPKDNLLCS